MRYYLIWPFIKWMLFSSTSGLVTLNKKYRLEMAQNPGLGIFVGIVCSVLFIAVSTILGVVIFESVKYPFLCAVVSSVSYVVYTFFSVLFNKFLEERNELFEVIKR